MMPPVFSALSCPKIRKPVDRRVGAAPSLSDSGLDEEDDGLAIATVESKLRDSENTMA